MREIFVRAVRTNKLSIASFIYSLQYIIVRTNVKTNNKKVKKKMSIEQTYRRLLKEAASSDPDYALLQMEVETDDWLNENCPEDMDEDF